MRAGVAIVVGLLHVALVLALMRAFAPGSGTRVAEQAVGLFYIATPPPDPPPAAPQPHRHTPERAGAAAAAGRRSMPDEAAAPVPRIVIASPSSALPIAGAGSAGMETGAGGQGSGTGSGTAGGGSGGGGAGKAEKIAGDINSARDYPQATREQRLGDYVVLALTVGTDGRVKGCRVHRASRDPDADRITCGLATRRFRFRPATDAAGNPVESVYGWRQWWFDPGADRNADPEPAPTSGI
ncbi:MAG: energy transducer TonB [Novosphingobium sp.]|nr:energy transducer TonB [Novosphingobium sp.]